MFQWDQVVGFGLCWDTHWTHLQGIPIGPGCGGVGGVQCVPVGHPLDQFVEFGWCACSVFQWDTHLTSLWGLGGVQCVPVGPVCGVWVV